MIFGYFALVTVQNCAVYLEMYRDSVIVLIAQRKIAGKLHIAAYTNLAQNIHPLKPNLSLTDQRGKLSKYFEQSLKSFSVFEI